MHLSSVIAHMFILPTAMALSIGLYLVVGWVSWLGDKSFLLADKEEREGAGGGVAGRAWSLCEYALFFVRL